MFYQPMQLKNTLQSVFDELQTYCESVLFAVRIAWICRFRLLILILGSTSKINPNRFKWDLYTE